MWRILCTSSVHHARPFSVIASFSAGILPLWKSKPRYESSYSLRCPRRQGPCSKKLWQTPTSRLSSSSRRFQRSPPSSKCASSSPSSLFPLSPSPSSTAWSDSSGVEERGRKGTLSLSSLRNTGMSVFHGRGRAVPAVQSCECEIVLYWSRLLHPFSSNITSEAFMKIILLSFHVKGLRYIDHWASP